MGIVIAVLARLSNFIPALKQSNVEIDAVRLMLSVHVTARTANHCDKPPFQPACKVERDSICQHRAGWQRGTTHSHGTGPFSTLFISFWSHAANSDRDALEQELVLGVSDDPSHGVPGGEAVAVPGSPSSSTKCIDGRDSDSSESSEGESRDEGDNDDSVSEDDTGPSGGEEDSDSQDLDASSRKPLIQEL